MTGHDGFVDRPGVRNSVKGWVSDLPVKIECLTVDLGEGAMTGRVATQVLPARQSYPILNGEQIAVALEAAGIDPRGVLDILVTAQVSQRHLTTILALNGALVDPGETVWSAWEALAESVATGMTETEAPPVAFPRARRCRYRTVARELVLGGGGCHVGRGSGILSSHGRVAVLDSQGRYPPTKNCPGGPPQGCCPCSRLLLMVLCVRSAGGGTGSGTGPCAGLRRE